MSKLRTISWKIQNKRGLRCFSAWVMVCRHITAASRRKPCFGVRAGSAHERLRSEKSSAPKPAYEPYVSGGICDEILYLVMPCDVNVLGNMLSGWVCFVVHCFVAHCSAVHCFVVHCFVVHCLRWFAPCCCDWSACRSGSHPLQKHQNKHPIAFVTLPIGGLRSPRSIAVSLEPVLLFTKSNKLFLWVLWSRKDFFR